MSSLRNRAREITLALLDQDRRIISAMETGTQINWSAEELARFKMHVAELEVLLNKAPSDSK
jgi:hypothetical protein